MTDFEEIDEKNASLFILEQYRHSLLAAIGAFDSYTSDLLRFLFLHSPHLKPAKPPARPGESQWEHTERVLSSTHLSRWRGRHDFLVEKFGASIEPGSLSKLAAFVDLRNQISHHGSARYDLWIDATDGQILANPKKIREISFQEAQEAHFIVAETCDAYIAGVSRSLFNDEPRVRPLIPEVIAVHRDQRSAWARRSSEPPDVEEVPAPNWDITQHDDHLWIRDSRGHFIVQPIDIGELVLLISFTPNTLHGAAAVATIDHNPSAELTMARSQDFLDQLLSGTSILVEYYESPWPTPRFARYSLAGFKQAWDRAISLQRS